MASAATENAKKVISQLLTSSNSHGSYCAGGSFPKSIPVPKITLSGDDGPPLSFPLIETDVARIKAKAERAGVGMPDRNVVNLDVRTTWQILPDALSVSNEKSALKHALANVARDLGTETHYEVKAHLYKLLHYEKGCFFARHRDTERLPNMFATLVIELPSLYEGAELSVSSPLSPYEKRTFFGSTDDSDVSRKMKFVAFYADCYHEVSELTAGHRVALVRYKKVLTTKFLQDQSLLTFVSLFAGLPLDGQSEVPSP